MKYLSIIITAIFLLGIQTNGISQKNTDRDQYEVRVDGLGCPFCAYGLEKTMKKLKGTKKLTIDMETGTLRFTFPSDPPLSIAQIEDQVIEAGYTPKSVMIERANGTVEKSEERAKTFDADQLVDASFYVAGKCDMCRGRIEAAAMRMEGVSTAEWNEDDKMLKVSYDQSVHAEEDVHKAVAKVGHDTKKFQAKDKTYKNLPGCCKYKRVN